MSVNATDRGAAPLVTFAENTAIGTWFSSTNITDVPSIDDGSDEYSIPVERSSVEFETSDFVAVILIELYSVSTLNSSKLMVGMIAQFV